MSGLSQKLESPTKDKRFSGSGQKQELIGGNDATQVTFLGRRGIYVFPYQALAKRMKRKTDDIKWREAYAKETSIAHGKPFHSPYVSPLWPTETSLHDPSSFCQVCYLIFLF